MCYTYYTSQYPLLQGYSNINIIMIDDKIGY